MQIENSTLNRMRIPYGASIPYRTSSQKFIDSLTGQITEENTVQSPSHISNANQETDPVKLYENMTSRTVTPQRSGKNIKGVDWNDDKLAFFVSLGCGDIVNTTKAINWNATGDRTLTSEQITELKGKYNLDNLSPQEYYDLMSDLTNMNVISAEDIHNMHLVTAPPAGLYPIDTSFVSRSFSTGNIFDNINFGVDSISNLNKFLLSNDFWKLNPNSDYGVWNDYIHYLDEKVDRLNHLNNILSAIRE